MTDPLLFTFPPELLRLILCGGEGLLVAYGPLRFIDPHYLDRKERDAGWSGSERLAYFSDADDCAAWGIDALESARMEWRLPLDHWRPRLALAAAWMLGIEARAADVHADTDGIVLVVWTGATTREVIRLRAWDAITGSSANTIDLPTLPAHLLTHDPAVALLLAIWDATEGRDR